MRSHLVLIFALISLGLSLRAYSETRSPAVISSAFSGATFLNTASESQARLYYAPINLEFGSQLTIISPERWKSVVANIASYLPRAHQDFEHFFGIIPGMATSIRLMDRESFFRTSEAPAWTYSLYWHGEIMIPLSYTQEIDFGSLYRSLRHEYSHAIVHFMSAGKCPGWLDEGLAQWSEGQEDPRLAPALRTWLQNNPPIPLRVLQGGFTKLDPETVVPAYAQALFASRQIMTRFGFKAIRKFLIGMQGGLGHESAFKEAFSISEKAFEKSLDADLEEFASRADRYPAL